MTITPANRQEINDILAMIEHCGAYNLTGSDESIIEYFEAAAGFRVLWDQGVHDLVIVIGGQDHNLMMCRVD